MRERRERGGDWGRLLDEQLTGVEPRQLIGHDGAAQVALDLEQLEVLRVGVECGEADPAVGSKQRNAA